MELWSIWLNYFLCILVCILCTSTIFPIITHSWKVGYRAHPLYAMIQGLRVVKWNTHYTGQNLLFCDTGIKSWEVWDGTQGTLFLSAQEYSFQITMRQQWNDKRLAYKNRLNAVMAGKKRLTGRNKIHAEGAGSNGLTTPIFNNTPKLFKNCFIQKKWCVWRVGKKLFK